MATEFIEEPVLADEDDYDDDEIKPNNQQKKKHNKLIDSIVELGGKKK